MVAHAVLSGVFVVRAIARFVGRPEVVPLVEDGQDFDVNEADHNVWNDLLQLFAHHTIAPLLVFALDDSSELSLALSCHFPSDVFSVMQHGLPGVLVDVEAVLSAAASDQENDQVKMQAAAALEAKVTGCKKTRTLCARKDPVLREGWDSSMSWCSWPVSLLSPAGVSGYPCVLHW